MSTLWRLIRLYKPYTGWMLLGILLALITILANIGLLVLSGWFISAMALAGAAGVSMNYFTPAALIRGAAITRTAGRYAERLVTHDATFRLLAELRVWFYEKIEPLAPAGLEPYRSGDVVSRIRADIDTLNNVYLRILVPTVVAALVSIILLIVLAYYHPLLAVVELSLLGIAGFFIPWLSHKLSAKTGAQLVDTQAQLRSQLVSDVQGMGELLVYGAAKQQAQQVHQSSLQLAQQQQHLNHLNGLAQAALGFCANLTMWLMLFITIPLVQQGTLAPAHLAMLALLALASFEAIAPLPLAWQSLGETLAAARRIFALTDQKPPITEPSQALPVPNFLSIQFEQVSFQYPNMATCALSDLNFSLEPREKLMILGANGSGKSTLLSLLLRFREPCNGNIFINNQPIQNYNSDDLRTQMAVAAQYAHLFNTTILDNLLLANPHATQDEVEQVCRAVLLHDFIQQQPEGYQTWVGETGARLSGGQVRRLAIARALLKPASLLILDEPTESLDPETAQVMMRHIWDQVEVRGQSLIVITHQPLGLIPTDFKILVLN